MSRVNYSKPSWTIRSLNYINFNISKKERRILILTKFSRTQIPGKDFSQNLRGLFEIKFREWLKVLLIFKISYKKQWVIWWDVPHRFLNFQWNFFLLPKLWKMNSNRIFTKSLIFSSTSYKNWLFFWSFSNIFMNTL